MAEKMTISNGVVYIDDGTIENVDFNACRITLGKAVKLKNCSIDDLCEVEVNG